MICQLSGHTWMYDSSAGSVSKVGVNWSQPDEEKG
jgi:hypothetical protein